MNDGQEQHVALPKYKMNAKNANYSAIQIFQYPKPGTLATLNPSLSDLRIIRLSSKSRDLVHHFYSGFLALDIIGKGLIMASVSTSPRHLFNIIFVAVKTQVTSGTVLKNSPQIIEVQRRRSLLNVA